MFEAKSVISQLCLPGDSNGVSLSYSSCMYLKHSAHHRNPGRADSLLFTPTAKQPEQLNKVAFHVWRESSNHK